MSGFAALHKLYCGTKLYGLSVAAVLNFLRFKLFRPRTGSVSTGADNIEVHFLYPEQFIPTLVLFREFVEPEYEFLRLILKPGFTFFDVGGGIGTYSILAAKQSDGFIHTFEPMKTNLKTIKKNLIKNGVESRVILNDVALSSRDGYCDIIEGENLFLSSIRTLTPSCDPIDGHSRVKTTTLDSYCAEKGIDFIDVIKIDVEGHEIEVIKGAENLIKKNKVGVIIFEVNPDIKVICKHIESSGFAIFYFHTAARSLIKVSPVNGEKIECSKPSPFNSNIICMAPGKVAEIQQIIAESPH